VVCAECDAAMRLLDEGASEQIEFVLASFRLVHPVRPKFARACCDHIAQAAAISQNRVGPPGLTRSIADPLLTCESDSPAPYRNIVSSALCHCAASG
jgi:hypothetical protein